MPRRMYDSVTAKDIPVAAEMVAGYISGTYRWSNLDWARFPHAVHVPIATQASVNDGIVLDVEPGDATPAQSVDWVIRRRNAGIDPTVYCNQLNGWAAVKQAFRNRGVPEPHYWVARYDNVAVIPVGAVAKQYIDPPLSGGHYDLSIVADFWPGIDEEDMAGITPEEITRIAERVLDYSIEAGSVSEALFDIKTKVDRLSAPVAAEIDYDRVINGVVEKLTALQFKAGPAS